MMENYEDFKMDSNGDTFSKKYDEYLSDKDDQSLLLDHLRQFEDNYFNIHGEVPSKEDLENAFRFMYMALAEIGETKPGSREARAASTLAQLIDDDSAVNTARNISTIPTVEEKKNAVSRVYFVKKQR